MLKEQIKQLRYKVCKSHPTKDELVELYKQTDILLQELASNKYPHTFKDAVWSIRCSIRYRLNNK